MADGSNLSITQKFMGMDTDSILERVEDGWYIEAWNLKIYAGADGNAGAVRKMGGTREIPWDAPLVGDNTGLGCYWDERGNTLIVFVHNSAGEHSILWMHPSETQARTITRRDFNFTEGTTVTGAAYINGTELVFTDDADYIKYVNLSRADETNKKSIVRLYFPPSSQIVDYREVRDIQISVNGIPQGVTFAFANATALDVQQFTPMVTSFAQQWNNNPTLRSAFEAHACANYVELTATQVGMYSVVASIRDYIASTAQPIVPLIAEFDNRYNGPIRREQILLGTIKPAAVPGAVIAFDPARKTSLVNRKQFQFCVRYRFKDNRHSLYGLLSDIALPVTSVCQNSTSGTLNCIDISFDDMWLQDPAMRGEIEWVDICMRTENNGSFFTVKSLEKYEWMYSRAWRFYNDQSYAGADKTQVLAGNTYLPPLAKGLELMVDKDDNTRIVVGGIKEGDENPCVAIVPAVILDGSTSVIRPRCRAIGRVRIISAFHGTNGYSLNQPIGIYNPTVGPVIGGMGGTFHENSPEDWRQRIPVGGYIVYAAGTDKWTITKQTVLGSSFPCGQNFPTIYPSAPGDHFAGRNVYDLTATGSGGLSQCSDEKRSAARHAIEGPGVWQEFSLEGLEPGQTYVLRFASTLCDFGTGDIYDLDSTTLGWQGTSARFWGVGTNFVPNYIEPDLFECVIHIPANGGGSTIDIGDCYTVDFTRGDNTGESYGIEAYLRDNLGQPHTAIDVRNGNPAEKQVLAFHEFLLGSSVASTGTAVFPPLQSLQDAMNAGITFSDHNGFAWFWAPRALLLTPHPRIAWLATTGITGTPGSVTGWGPNIGTNFTIMNDFDQDKYAGDFTGALATVAGDLSNGAAPPKTTLYFVPNLNPSTLQCRTHLDMSFITSSGDPLQGVVAVFTNSPVSRLVSGTDGLLSLIAYADCRANNNDRLLDSLVFYYQGLCIAAFPQNPLDILITDFVAGQQWSETVRFIVPDIIVSMIGQGNGRGWGRGSSRPFGYYLERENGDRTAVSWLFDATFPLLVQDLFEFNRLIYPVPGTFSSGVGQITYNILGDVPIPWLGRYTHLQFVAGEDTTRDWYLQWAASSVTYSSIWSTTDSSPTQVSFASGLATEIYISISDSTDRYSQINTGSIVNLTDPNVAYLWQRGDMLRVLTYSDGTPMNGRVVDVPITGQRGRWITIAASSTIPELKGGEVIEIYRPRKPVDTDVATYYDVPDGRIDIIDAFGSNPQWSSLSGTLKNGDMWLISSQIPIRPSDQTSVTPSGPWMSVSAIRESAWQSDFWPSKGWGRGKPWFANPDAKVEERPGLMRYSDSFKPGTNINGLNFFGGFSYKQVENFLGKIMVMYRMQDVIFCVCENGCFSIYVGLQQTRTTPDALVEVADGILGNVRPFAHKHGTRHPESVVRRATTIVFFDWTNGAWVQYNSNELGDRAAQERMHAYFTDKSMSLPDGANVPGGWDMVNGQFITSFPVVYRTEYGGDDLPVERLIPAESITYHDDANKFISKIGYYPNCWGTTRQQLWSFKDGRLLMHEAPGAVENRIDGVDLELSITPAFIGNETTVKQPQALWVGRGPGWEVSRVTVSDEGQVSIIPAEDFETYRGGVSKAPFFKDQNTPASALTIPQLSNGDQLIGTAFAVELRFVGTGRCRLLNATMFYIEVTPTN